MSYVYDALISTAVLAAWLAVVVTVLWVGRTRIQRAAIRQMMAPTPKAKAKVSL